MASTHSCAICQAKLPSKIFKDFWGNCFCMHHQYQFDQCTSCGRLICEALTQGGFRYPDGLIMCSLCDRRGVFSVERAKILLKDMRKELKINGLDLQNAKIPIRLVDRDELFRRSRRSSNEGHIVLGLTRGLLSSVNDKVVDKRFMEILIQRGLPDQHFKLVAIHELCHAWIFYRGIHHLPLQMEEGLCVLSEYIWLQRQKGPEIEFWKQSMLENKDPIYGDGFRKALKCTQKMPFPRMMRYIEENKKFPGFFANMLFI